MTKSKLLFVLGFLLLASFVLLAGNLPPLQASAVDKVEPGLRDEILAAGEGAYWVYLAEKADLSGAYSINDWNERGHFVYNTLLETARTSQADIVNLLDQEQTTGNVSRFQSFFIVNALLVTSNVNTLDALAARADVARLEPSRSYKNPEPVIDDVDAVAWGGAKIRAIEVWGLGFHGEGVVVGSVDSGVDYDHPALVDQYRGNLGGGSFDHNYNWYDPVAGCPTPCDASSMGTHTMGTLVGDDGDANQIGVAPGAKWIAARGCYHYCEDYNLLAAAEWMLAPCPVGVDSGEPGCDPDRRPNIVNNSWGGALVYPYDPYWFATSVQAWRAADIFPAFTAWGSGANMVPGGYEEAFAGGATDINDVIYVNSGRGPTPYTDEFKPDVTAPGVNIRSAVIGGGYASLTSTALASAHVAGCAALLKSADSSLTIDQLEDLLRDYAVDLGAPGPDYDYGLGRIDCYESLLHVSPGFSLLVQPDRRTVCAPNTASFGVEVGQLSGYTQPITLTAEGQPDDLIFYPEQVTPPGSSYFVAHSGSTPGIYPITVHGTGSGAQPRAAEVELAVFTATPETVTLVSPPDDGYGTPLLPTFEWDAVEQAYAYLLVVRNLNNGQLMHALTSGTSYTFATPLELGTDYAWSVRAQNPCGLGEFAPFRSFTTQGSPPILLVDDDDNNPDVRSYYIAALEALGMPYTVWDTANSDNEPQAATLQQYDAVIWFTGDEYGGFAGPGTAGELALAIYLSKANGCLFLSSQDYIYDRGFTDFVKFYLGVSSVYELGQTIVTGLGAVYGELGPYTLDYPFVNFSDMLREGSGTGVAFWGSGQAAALYREAGYRTTFWAFPWEALPTADDRQATLSATLNWCMQP